LHVILYFGKKKRGSGKKDRYRLQAITTVASDQWPLGGDGRKTGTRGEEIKKCCRLHVASYAL
jgi:hypothetical protein